MKLQFLACVLTKTLL